MQDHARLIRLRRYGQVLTLLALAVVGVSAWLRLAGAGLGCGDWPGCYASFLNGTPYAVPLHGRVIHRVVATAALLLACFTCWYSLKPVSLQPVARQSIILLVLMLLLAVVGIWSSEPRRVLVNFINLLGGLALVSFSWRVVLATNVSGRRSVVRRHSPLLRAGLLALTITLVIGALIGARYAAATCNDLPHCGGVWWPQDWSGFNPLSFLVTAARPADPDGVALHLMHRVCGVATFLLLGAAALRSMRLAQEGSVRRAAFIVIVLLTAEVLFGILTVASGYVLWLAIAHNIGAALLLASAAQLVAET